MSTSEHVENEEQEPAGLTDFFIAKFGSLLESQKSANLVIIVMIFVAAIPIFGIGFYSTRPIAPVEAAQVAPQASIGSGSAEIAALFRCAEGKSITALFQRDTVELSLSDGRELVLPQVRSGSGARYANPDESFVFWNKGNTAFIEEVGVLTYSGCVAAGS